MGGMRTFTDARASPVVRWPNWVALSNRAEWTVVHAFRARAVSCSPIAEGEVVQPFFRGSSQTVGAKSNYDQVTGVGRTVSHCPSQSTSI